MNAFLASFLVILQSVLGVFFMCFVGIMLTRFGILSKEISSGLSKIAFNCFLPALLFTNISQSIEVHHLYLMGIIMIFAVIYITLSFTCGLLLHCILKPDDDFKGGIVCATSFGNTVTIPIALISTLKDAPPFLSYPDAVAHGLAFISIYSIISSAAQWGVGLNYLKYQATIYHRSTERQALIQADEGKSADIQKNFVTVTSEERQKLISSYKEEQQAEEAKEDEEENLPYTPHASDRFEESKPLLPSKKKFSLKACFRNIKWKEIFERYISPPVIANLMGIIVGLSPAKNYLFPNYAIFKCIGDSLITLGQAQVPVVLLILGVNMARRPEGKEQLKTSSIFAVILVRLILFPWIGIGLTQLALHLNLIPRNPVLLFILMLEAGMPPALNLVVMSNLVNMGQSKMAFLQFWAYAFSLISLTLYGSLYLYLIS